MTAPSEQTDKKLPADLAARLRALRDVDNALLNVYLAALRDLQPSWPAPVLADALEMKSPAVNKRIQRARERQMQAIAARPLRRAARQGAPRATQAWRAAAPRVEDYQRCRAQVARTALPAAPVVYTMMDGRQLEPEIIDKLRRMQPLARINGAVAADDQARDVSEEFAALLHHLVSERGFSAYYLARVLGFRSTRAITSRLERHHYRDPCPSTAGTSSGQYSRRKIGDPGSGAPRLEPHQRQVLRDRWDQFRQYDTDRQPATESVRIMMRDAVIELVRQHMDAGFSLANLAQAMTSPDRRVRYSELTAVLAEHRLGEPAVTR